MPKDGEIPIKDTVEEQAALANDVALQVPPDPFLNILAHWRVLEQFPDREVFAATSACAIGRLYDDLDMPVPAVDAYAVASDSHRSVLPQAAIAGIYRIRIRAFAGGDAAVTAAKRATILKEARERLEAVLRSYPESPDIKARAAIEEARILSRLGDGAAPLLNAIETLTRAVEDDDTPREYKAEAALLRADLFARAGGNGALLSAYLEVLRQYPDMNPWADQAVERILEWQAGGGGSPDAEERERTLQGIARRYRTDLPRLSMGAWNRLGDLYYAGGDRTAAKNAYRQVMSQFRVADTQTAAARLALAEILYEEERFRQALDLYETEMAGRPFEDRMYRLAREGYERKSLLSAEFLFRLGEIPAAQTAFVRLIREKYDLVAAHRGYIKCAAARKQIPAALGRYTRELERRPDDPVTLYALGLCMTYDGGPDSLAEAGRLIDQAISAQGQVAYFHQTRGYIYEVMETVHGKPGRLESALASYQKAYFLNDRARDPENAAHLALNLGNVHLLLGQYAKAFEYYLERYNSGVAFDREETEILFFRRFGQCAFQVREREKPVLAFSRALELIDKRIDPKRCSVAMGRIDRYVSDRILAPALRRPRLKDKARLLIQRQSDLNGKVFETSGRHVAPPPDATWERYRRDMQANIIEQRAVVEQLPPLAPAGDAESMASLRYMLVRATEALDFPEEMIQLKAEMLDRLGLSYQEEGEWERARSAYEQAFMLNRGLGRFANLAVNRRSSAYCAYMQADETPGPGRQTLLETSLAGFKDTIDLVNRYGVPVKDGGARGGGVLSMKLDVALDAAGATGAAFGFSAEQEVRLAETFIARIKTESGLIEPARDLLNLQLAQYPPGRPVPEKDLYGVSLLAHRAGHLAYAEGRHFEAFSHFQRSAELALKLKNPVSAAINVANMGVAALAMPSRDDRRPACRVGTAQLDRETSRLLSRARSVLERAVIAEYHNTLGAIWLHPKWRESPEPLERASLDMWAVQVAGVHFSRGIDLLTGSGIPEDRKGLALLAALHLNMATAAGAKGNPVAAETHFEKALDHARRGLLPFLEWRALAGLGRLREALELLESVTLLHADSAPGEITRLFSPMVRELIEDGNAEDAFNLLERVSELERVQRLTPLVVREFSSGEKAVFRKLYPRLLTIRELNLGLMTAPAGDKPYIRTRLAQEKALLMHAAGPQWERVPSLMPGIGSETVRDHVVILLGLAFEAEAVSETIVENRGDPDSGDLKTRRRELIAQYREELNLAFKSAGTNAPPGLIGMLRPDPAEAVDVMEILPETGVLIRLFEKEARGNAWTAFVLRPDDVRTASFSPTELEAYEKDDPVVVAYEEPSELSFPQNGTLALSGTHLFRSFENRNPFRRKVLALPPLGRLPEAFTAAVVDSPGGEKDIIARLPAAHTLWLDGPITLGGSVPTRQGRRPEPPRFRGTGTGPQDFIDRTCRVTGTRLAGGRAARAGGGGLSGGSCCLSVRGAFRIDFTASGEGPRFCGDLFWGLCPCLPARGGPSRGKPVRIQRKTASCSDTGAWTVMRRMHSPGGGSRRWYVRRRRPIRPDHMPLPSRDSKTHWKWSRKPPALSAMSPTSFVTPGKAPITSETWQPPRPMPAPFPTCWEPHAPTPSPMQRRC